MSTLRSQLCKLHSFLVFITTKISLKNLGKIKITGHTDSSRTEKERNIREQWNININKQYIKTFPNVNSQSLFEMEAIFKQTLE
jgi:hypothetical protein